MGATYNPIGKSGPYENGFFSPIPVPPPGYANVLTGGQNECVPMVIQSGVIPRKEQIRQGKYNWMTQIDIQPHRISFEAELLAQDNISHFLLTVDMSARAEAPGKVCLDNITDVAAAVKSEILPELQAKAIRSNMDDIQQLRANIDGWLNGVILLNSGIQLSNIRVHIQPDQAYIRRREALRREDEEKEDKLRKLQEKKEYERERAMAADELSKMYDSDVTQAFAELASDEITPEEAARRIEARRKSQAAEGFDEKMRQMREFVDLVKMMRENDIGSPDMLGQKADQLLGSIFTPASAAPGLNGRTTVPALEEAASEQTDAGLFAPPPDD